MEGIQHEKFHTRRSAQTEFDVHYFAKIPGFPLEREKRTAPVRERDIPWGIGAASVLRFNLAERNIYSSKPFLRSEETQFIKLIFQLGVSISEIALLIECTPSRS